MTNPNDDLGPPIPPSGTGGSGGSGVGSGAGGSGQTGGSVSAAGGSSGTTGGSTGTSTGSGAGGSTSGGAGGSLPQTGGAGGTGGAPGTGGTTGTGSGGSTGTGGGTGGTSGTGTRDGGAPMAEASVPIPGRDAGAPTPSGGSIVLGQTTVPKENVIAFIHIGHSNNAGRATSPTASLPYHQTQVDPYAWLYKTGAVPRSALEPLTAGDGNGTRWSGPGTSLVKQAAAMAPGKYTLSLGFGQGSAYCTQFLPGGLYYDRLMAAPKAVKGRVTYGAIVIMLGITERHGTAADVAGYPDCINKLVTAIRTDVGEPNLPLLLTDYEVESTDEFAVSGAVARAIMPQIARVPSVVSNSALVPCNAIPMQDDHHFNLDGHKMWTARALQILKDKGWAPWAP